MALRAGEDKVIVVHDARKETTVSGLILPVSSDENIVTGQVVDGDVKYTGCNVFFHKQNSTEIEVDKVKYFVVDIKNILAYIGL